MTTRMTGFNDCGADLARQIKASIERAKGPDASGWYSGCCPLHEDKDPSFGWTEGGYKCHGCGRQGSIHELARHLGIAVAGDSPDIVGWYDYLDEEGNLLFQVVRKLPKKFLQRRPDGNGGWVWKLRGVRPVLYRLPRLRKAIEAKERVFVVEGEKDVHTLEGLGLIATTCPSGAGKWRDEYTRSLAGASVVILPDNDEPGGRHAEQVANALLAHALEVRVLRLPGLPEKGDVSDWVEHGGSREGLEELAGAAPLWQSPSPKEDQESPSEHLTDAGNALRLVRQHGAELRYVRAWGTWLVWDGVRWARDRTGEVERRAKAVARSIYHEAAETHSKDERAEISKWARSSESAGRLGAMIRLAESEAEIAATPEEFDCDPWKLNVLNGTVDLRTGLLLPHNPSDLITKLAPVAYGPLAQAPQWEAFLQRVMAGDRETISFLKRFVGYCLTGDTREQKLVIAHGTGSNGKSTFIEALRSLLGDYAMQTPTETLMLKRSGGIPNDVARLQGARFVSAVETEAGRALAEALVKSLTGQDTVVARFLHQEFFEFRPEFKILLGVNHKPNVKGTDHAIWRRICLIPFTVTIPEEDQDKELTEKLRAELSGVLNWALEGCLEWQDVGLGEPSVVLEATQAYREEMDELGEFLNACCELHPSGIALSSDLYRAYQQWAEKAGEEPLSQKMFGYLLTERGIGSDRKGPRRATRRIGISLKSDTALRESTLRVHEQCTDTEYAGFTKESPSRKEKPQGQCQTVSEVAAPFAPGQTEGAA
ncbi:phage/plasmid primase, P4 family [Gemmatimonadota bacterium]